MVFIWTEERSYQLNKKLRYPNMAADSMQSRIGSEIFVIPI